MTVKYTIEVDDKGRVVLRDHAKETGKTGDAVDRAGRKMEQRWNSVSKSITGLHNKIKGFATSIPAKLGFAGFLASGLKIIQMATKEEEIFRKLQTAVELSGESWEKAKPRIDEFIASMQKTTRYGDSEMAPALQMIIQLTGSLEKGLEGAKIAADIASTGLFDLTTASRYVAMAMEGEVTMLGRYIPALKEAALKQAGIETQSQKVAYAMSILREKFGGAAQKDISSFGGVIKQIKNYIGDVLERAGDLIKVRLAPMFREWRDAIIEFIEKGKLEEWAKKAGEKVGEAFDKIKSGINWIIQNKDWFINAFKIAAIGVVVIELGNVAVKIIAIKKAITGLSTAIAGSAAVKSLLGMGAATAGTAALTGGLSIVAAELLAIFISMYKAEKATNELNKSTDLYLKTLDKFDVWYEQNAEKLKNIGISFQFDKDGIMRIRQEVKNVASDVGGTGGFQEAGIQVGDAIIEGMAGRFRASNVAEIPVNQFQKAGDEIEDVMSDTFKEIERISRNASFNMASALMSDFESVWNKIFGYANSTFEKMFQAMVSAFVEALAEMLAEWITTHIIMAAISALLGGGGGLTGNAGGSGSLGSSIPASATPQGVPALMPGMKPGKTYPGSPALNYPVQSGSSGGVTMQGDTIIIQGGMDPKTVRAIAALKQRNREQLMKDIQALVTNRRLTV